MSDQAHSINALQIVVVAEAITCDPTEFSWDDPRVDQPSSSHIEELLSGFRANFSDVVWYRSPDDFIKHISVHRNSIILPYWFGENSRNRHSIVPAICEAENIRYIGGDCYTKIVCNDKSISKILAQRAGLEVSNGVTIYDENFSDLNILRYPCVVKPIFEGSSLGISRSSIVKTPTEAAALTRTLLDQFSQPVEIEEFIHGKEVSIALLGWQDNVKLWHAGERYKIGCDDWFFDRIYAFDEKKLGQNLALRSINDEICAETLRSCKRLFSWLDKVEYMRIDGRLDQGKFTMIELTPETHLGAGAEFCGVLSLGGIRYEDVLKEMVINCLERYQNLSARMTKI